MGGTSTAGSSSITRNFQQHNCYPCCLCRKLKSWMWPGLMGGKRSTLSKANKFHQEHRKAPIGIWHTPQRGKAFMPFRSYCQQDGKPIQWTCGRNVVKYFLSWCFYVSSGHIGPTWSLVVTCGHIGHCQVPQKWWPTLYDYCGYMCKLVTLLRPGHIWSHVVTLVTGKIENINNDDLNDY